MRISGKIFIIFAIIIFFIILISTVPLPTESYVTGTKIKLPEPRLEGEMSVEEALLKRRSIRDFLNKPIPLDFLSQILWAAQGITSESGGRTAPSAGALYPLEIYIQVRKVEELKEGVYHYNLKSHSLDLIKEGDFSSQLTKAGLSQEWIKDASLNLIVTADFSRTTRKYGERGIRYVYMEAGHCGQNIYLQTTVLGLGNVVIGAFNNEDVKNVLSIPKNHEPIYIIPIGVPS
ncbi:MAG: SagB/ThcOx family dehydrogenase [Candidatus Aenigmarchaeota archaeon]|nr:SagB/ThcOx family dehydrogenase [Candidatus Aenigmarchaeota archaeon]NIO44763.1 SagB/ThcOx family dehydrogenase [Candidatus Aenigmarchaeota archaeon]